MNAYILIYVCISCIWVVNTICMYTHTYICWYILYVLYIYVYPLYIYWSFCAFCTSRSFHVAITETVRWRAMIYSCTALNSSSSNLKKVALLATGDSELGKGLAPRFEEYIGYFILGGFFTKIYITIYARLFESGWKLLETLLVTNTFTFFFITTGATKKTTSQR